MSASAKITASFLAAMLVLGMAPFIGATSLPAFFLTRPESLDAAVSQDIFWNLRVPRVLLGFLSGAALGMAGMVFQALFRNPLATPYTLGVANGASFGAVLAIHSGLLGSFLGVPLITVFGFLGAVLATILVYALSRSQQCVSTVTMLLAGVAISFFFSSLIIFMQYLSNFTESFRIIRWLMGGLEVVGYEPVLQVLPPVIVGTLLVMLLRKELDILSTGDELAFSRGVDVNKVRYLLFFVVSLMIGGVVSLTGPIGFIGLIVPHVCRLVFGVSHSKLAPLTFLISGTFLVSCDALARVLIAPAEIPVGVITALLGGPFFLWLLFRSKRFGTQ